MLRFSRGVERSGRRMGDWTIRSTMYIRQLIKKKHNKITQTLFLQIFGHAAFIKQKVR